jgi:hypothetical protein
VSTTASAPVKSSADSGLDGALKAILAVAIPSRAGYQIVLRE